MFEGVLATPLLLIFLISFEELNFIETFENRIYFFPGLERFRRKDIAQNKAATSSVLSFPWFRPNLLIYGVFLDLNSLTCISHLLI